MLLLKASCRSEVGGQPVDDEGCQRVFQSCIFRMITAAATIFLGRISWLPFKPRVPRVCRIRGRMRECFLLRLLAAPSFQDFLCGVQPSAAEVVHQPVAYIPISPPNRYFAPLLRASPATRYSNNPSTKVQYDCTSTVLVRLYRTGTSISYEYSYSYCKY